MPARRKNETPAELPNDLSFESAMAELEGIVEAMEAENLPLEQLIAQYEAGARLLKHCDTVLQGARKRIELITLSDREADESPVTSSGNDEEDHDITLF